MMYRVRAGAVLIGIGVVWSAGACIIPPGFVPLYDLPEWKRVVYRLLGPCLIGIGVGIAYLGAKARRRDRGKPRSSRGA